MVQGPTPPGPGDDAGPGPARGRVPALPPQAYLSASEASPRGCRGNSVPNRDPVLVWHPVRIVWPPTGRRHCHDSVGPGSACTTRRVPVSARSWLGPLAAAQPDNGPARPGPSAVTPTRAGPRRALLVRSPGSTRFPGGGHASFIGTDSRARRRRRRARPPLGDRLAGVRLAGVRRSRPWTQPPPSPGSSASDESAGLLRQGPRESPLGGHTWWRAPLRPERAPPGGFPH